MKKLTISRQGAKAQSHPKSNSLLFFATPGALRLGEKRFCSSTEYFTDSIRWGSLVLALLIAVPAAYSAAQDAEEVLAHARTVYGERGCRDALPEFEKALALFRAKHDRHGEAVALGQIGNCYESLPDYPRALDYLGRALALAHELGDRLQEAKTLSNQGLVYWHRGDYSQAIHNFTQAREVGRELKDQRVEAATENNLGLVYDETGEYDRALESHRRSAALFRSIHNEQGEGEALGNVGLVYYSLGEFREAARYYQQALEIDQRLKLMRQASTDLGDLALCQFALGETDLALSNFDKAIQLAREGGFAQEEADWHKGKGSALQRLGKYDLARGEFGRALEVYQQAGLKRELIEALADDGALHTQLGDLASAEADYRRALDIARAIGHPAGVTDNLLSLGDLEWRRQHYDQAAALYRDAYARAREAGEKDSMASSLVALALALRDQGEIRQATPLAAQALEIARGTGARLTEAAALHALAELARKGGEPAQSLERYQAGEKIAQAAGDTELGWQLAFGRGQALEALQRNQEAVAAYRHAVEIIEGVRSQLREERFRAGYLEDKFQVYVALVRLLLKMGKAGEAFLYSEKLRAQSYLDLLNRSDSLVSDPKEIELRARIRELQRVIEEETTKPQSERKSGKLKTFSAKLAEAERQYQALLDDRRRTHPDRAADQVPIVPSPAQVEARLPPRSALVEYILGGDFVAIFLVRTSGVESKLVSADAADITTKVELFRDLVAKPGSTDWVKSAESLYALLVQPLEQAGWLKGVTDLYVVPHKVLHYLPFAALPRPGSDGRHFLVEDYVLAYLPAAAALVNRTRPVPAGLPIPSGQVPPGATGTRGTDPQSPRNLFALAPARTRLRFTEQEARAVGAFFPNASLVLTGSRATESAFKAQAARYGVIHLATHAFFDNLNPAFSGVELEPDSKEDGRLEVHEILRLRLQARLVTLSACETALGSGYFSEYPPGDEFVGLTRAFLTAGSSQVLASLWEVNDQSTLELMRGFYDNLRQSGDAEALRQAQLTMLQGGGRFAHPYYWAPFVLIGAKK